MNEGKMETRWIHILILAGLLPLLGGCFSLSTYRTAKTLPENVSELGIAYTATKISKGEVGGPVPVTENGVPVLNDDGTPKTEPGETTFPSFFLPNGLAELWFAVGLQEDLELTFRTALHSGYMEMGVNYRLIGSDHSAMHLAIAPSIGGRFLVLFEGFTGTLPVTFTYLVSDNVSLTGSGFVSYNTISMVDGFGGGSGSSDLFGGDFLTAGGAFQLRFEGETFYVGPIFEYSHTVANFNDSDFDISLGMNMLFVGITSGWYFGKEKIQLDRMEKKIDKIGDKLGVDEEAAPERYNFSWLNQVDEDENVSLLDPR